MPRYITQGLTDRIMSRVAPALTESSTLLETDPQKAYYMALAATAVMDLAQTLRKLSTQT